MRNSLILCSRNKDEAGFARDAADAGQFDLTIVESPAKAVDQFLSAPSKSILLASAENVAELNRITEIPMKNRVHVLTRIQEVDRLAAGTGPLPFGHLVVCKENWGASDGLFYSKILNLQDRKKGNAGLRAYITPTGEIQTIEFTESLQKGFAATAVTYQLQELGCNERISSLIAGAVDELLINAMYGTAAPKANAAIYGVEMQLGIENEIIAIKVSGLTGGIDNETGLRNLVKVFGSRFDLNRESSSGGAGLGLALVLKSGGSLCFVNNSKQNSEITVLYRKCKSVRELKSQTQFISMLSL